MDPGDGLQATGGSGKVPTATQSLRASPPAHHTLHLTCVLSSCVLLPFLTAENVPGLFARNERVVTLFDTPVGKMAIVLVGATIVASIDTVWAGTVTPPAGKHVTHWRYDADGDDAITIGKGEEMGQFKLGSTIVVCFEADKIDFADLAAEQVTRLGTPFATFADNQTQPD